jgi:hypothetical protein
MRHTVSMRQSVILTRKFDYAAFCQGAIMSFYTSMWLGAVLLDVVLLVVMRHFTTLRTERGSPELGIDLTILF